MLHKSDDWVAQATEGIERHRLVPCTLQLLGPDGRPLPDGSACCAEQASHAFKFGCMLNGWGLCRNQELESAFRDRFCHLFNYASVLFHWGKSLSQRTDYEFADGQTEYAQRDAMIRWCENQGLAVKGHPLVFFFQPSWVAERDPGEPEELLWRRVQREAGNFAGRLAFWETVNESSWQGERAMEYNAVASRDVFARLGPQGVIDKTHQMVESLDPEVGFILNESYPTEEFRQVLEGLLQAGIRVDGIGFQNHGIMNYPDAHELWALCDDWGQYGIPLHFTELMMPSCSHEGRPLMTYTMNDNAAWPTSQEGEARQAAEVEQTYSALFSHPAVAAITWWGLSDYLSCLDAAIGLLREDMSAKPAYETLDDLIHHRWRSRVSDRCDSSGILKFRGFQGQYDLTAITPSGQQLIGHAEHSGDASPTIVHLSSA